MVLQLNLYSLLGIVLVCSPINILSKRWGCENLEYDNIEEIAEMEGPWKKCEDIPEELFVNRVSPKSMKNQLPKRGSPFSNGWPLIHRHSCQMIDHLRDLGPSYFPRYLETQLCKRDSCGNLHYCKEKHYPVGVLKLANSSEMAKGSECIPSNIKGHSWTPERFNVGVDCECMPIIDLQTLLINGGSVPNTI